MLLTDQFNNPHPLIAAGQLQLAAWKLSNVDSKQGISEETSQLLAAGWSRGTNTTYQSAWKRWNSWCSGWQINPISCSIQSFLEFLTSIFKGGLHYRIINVIWSAISMTHDHIEGIPMGQHNWSQDF